jgi:outer membrane protein OmpA-like peptidoglycan-associated protein
MMRRTYVENEPASYSSDEDDKLIPGWSQTGDNQIVYLGLLVALILGLSWGCSNVLGNNDTIDDVAGQLGVGEIDLSDVENDYGIRAERSGDSTAVLRGTVASQALKNRAGRDALAIDGIRRVDNRLRIASAGATDSTVPALEVGDLQGAMDLFSVTGTIDGEQAILTGFVGTAAESATAEVAALRVQGITTVSNRLVILEPLAEAALTSAGARDVDPTSADGRTITAVGYVDNEDQRAAALAALSAVDGVTGSIRDELIVLDADVLASLGGVGANGLSVTVVDGIATLRGEVPDEATRAGAIEAAMVPGIVEVIDELTLPAEPEPEPEPEGTDTRDGLNALFEANPIQFNSGSAVIKEESFAILDQALELLAETDVALEIQGYTDKTGDVASNQTLSEERAQAVLDYLVANGASGDQLTSNGYGPTEEFGAGDSSEALAANRRVRFELA